MAKQASYRVHIPTQDTLGQPLHEHLASAAHEWLSKSRPRLFHDIWTEGPHRHSYGWVDHLVALAEDSPETDGYVKQLAAHVGEITNHPTITVGKQNKDGFQSWQIPNRKYIEGQGSAYARGTAPMTTPNAAPPTQSLEGDPTQPSTSLARRQV